MIAVAVSCALVAAARAQQRPLPDPQTFLQEARKHLETDDDRQRGYVYTETRRDQKLDKEGRPTSESTRIFESYPGLPGEGRWERVISEDGRPVPPRDLEKVDRERQTHAEEYARKLARNPAKLREAQAADRERRLRERAESIDEAFRLLDMRLQGREAIDGHDTIVFDLAPRPGVKSRTRVGGILRSFSGRVWVSEADYELVRLRLEAVDTVSIGFGLLARLHRGSRLSFERRKVNGEAWLPARANYSFSARVGLVALMRRGAIVEFSDYKKFGVDSAFQVTPREAR